MKSIVLGVIGAVVVGGWSVQAGAAVTVAIGDYAGMPGDDVDVTVSLAGSEGNVATVQLDILFPDAILAISPAADCALADRLTDNLFLYVFQPEPDRARFLVIDLQFPSALISDGDLFTCTFHILPEAPGTVADLIGDRFEVADDFAMPIAATIEDGSVTVLLCGNGLLDAGEACDAGGDNGTSRSCCTATCQFVADGNASCDGNECTRPDTCTAGVCTPGSCADGAACTVCGGVCADTGSSCTCE
jgi:hypothetical protein